MGDGLTSHGASWQALEDGCSAEKRPATRRRRRRKENRYTDKEMEFKVNVYLGLVQAILGLELCLV